MWRPHRCLLVSTCVQSIAVVVYLRAFLRLPDVVDHHDDAHHPDRPFSERVFAEHKHLSSCPSTRRPLVTHLAVVLVDALAARFVIDAAPHLHAAMPFLHAHTPMSLVFTANAQTPTVTLPRIKAITTGTIPSFADVALNFAASNVTTDSWVLHRAPVVFYGDDTWLRVFPSAMHARSEGTTSFFVADYTAVDANVTRHLDVELATPLPWRTLILHYLGLDHIGHSFGAHSPLVVRKLREMDAVVGRVYDALANEVGARPMLVVLGDHGMTGQGSHGGSSSLETQVPVIFMSPHMTVPMEKARGMEQLDVASTISHLTGTPPPTGSLGVPPVDLFEAFGWSEVHTLDMQQTTLTHLCARMTNAVDEWLETECRSLPLRHEELLISLCEGRSGLETERRELGERYAYVLRQVQRALMATSGSYDMTSMLLCTIAAVITSSVSMWHVLDLRSLARRNLRRPSLDLVLTISTTIVHPLSYLATSFVEEEHLMWYYAMATALAVITVSRLRDEQSSLRLVMTFVSIIALALYMTTLSRHPSIVWLTALIAIAYRHSEWTGERGVHLAQCVFVLSAAHMAMDRRASTALLLALLVVCRPAQLPLLLLVVLLARLLPSLDGARRPHLGYLLLGCAWFYAGGSNQISSMDISRGYIGLSEYNSVIVGALILLNAYGGLVAACCALSAKHAVSLLDYVLAHRSCLLAMSMLTTTLNGEHLFVWSVFAPKLVFDTLHWAVAVILLLLSAAYEYGKYVVIIRRKMK